MFFKTHNHFLTVYIHGYNHLFNQHSTLGDVYDGMYSLSRCARYVCLPYSISHLSNSAPPLSFPFSAAIHEHLALAWRSQGVLFGTSHVMLSGRLASPAVNIRLSSSVANHLQWKEIHREKYKNHQPSLFLYANVMYQM